MPSSLRPSNNFGMFFGTKSGGTTLDQDEFGGNPFATSLIELASRPEVTLRNLPARLSKLTSARTQGRQVPQCEVRPAAPGWRFTLDLGSRSERRAALVLIVSDYSRQGLQPLYGAATDERRISAMLASHGFTVAQGITPTREALSAALRSFSKQSRQFDVAVVYCTGHGVEIDSEVFLLPGDYPFSGGCSRGGLRANAISIARVASSSQGTKLNLVFFAGCRTLVSK
jgi:hypothetical protein